MDTSVEMHCVVVVAEETLAESLTRHLVETKDVQKALAPVGSVMCVLG